MAAGRSPLRGAWIEMVYKVPFDDVAWVAPPCGERGLKYHFYHLLDQFHRRSPLRGAWIEISGVGSGVGCSAASLPLAGSVD